MEKETSIKKYHRDVCDVAVQNFVKAVVRKFDVRRCLHFQYESANLVHFDVKLDNITEVLLVNVRDILSFSKILSITLFKAKKMCR